MVLVICDDYGYKLSTPNIIPKGAGKSVRASGGLFSGHYRHFFIWACEPLNIRPE